VLVERDLPVPMRDGTILLADHWYPSTGATGPAILVRTPYGQEGNAGVATMFAERGRHILIQRCRGTFGSQGEFTPFDEADDGADTLAWLRAQNWYPGSVHTWGFSYLGVTQWAVCAPGISPNAMQIALSARDVAGTIICQGGGFSISNTLVWVISLAAQERSKAVRWWTVLNLPRRLARAALTLPPIEADVAATGHPVSYYRDWVTHSQAGDPWWNARRHASNPADVPPVVLLAGWQDLFLRGQVEDYSALAQAGRPVRLIVGDWSHSTGNADAWSAFEMFRPPAETGQPLAGPPVRIEVTGGAGWRDLDHWPPPAAALKLNLTTQLTLTASGTETSETSYIYDPLHPTPQAGGRALNPFDSGRRGQGRRERRRDVVVFTGQRLTEDLTVAGEAEFVALFESTNPTPDFAVRLCQVNARGVSRTVADGYIHLPPPDPAEEGRLRRVVVPIGPLAHRFVAGQRIRLQVSSGAHPLHLRNPGAGAPPTDPGRLAPSTVRLLFGGDEGCQLVLPQVDLDQLALADDGPR
jgi:putative CocE/NonD family hydrolase